MKHPIMILGAGVYQLLLIKTAKEMGIKTVVVSPKGPFPGIPLADVFLDIDTTDIRRILAAAREYSISGIVTTGTDMCVPTIGAVVDALGLRGPNKQIADIASSKTTFRTFLQKSLFNFPYFVSCTCPQDVWNFHQKSTNKIVIKPDDSSGSRGVTILEHGQTQEAVLEAYRNAVKSARNGRVCAESFVEGKEVGGEAFFLNGKLHFFTTTYKHLNGIVVQGHSVPSDLSDSELMDVRDEVSRVAFKLGYENGPMNFDVIINGRKAVILDIGLRNGGNGILDLIYHSQGINLAEWLLIYAQGGVVPEQRCFETKEISSYVFGSKQAGRLTALSGLHELIAAVPEVFEMYLSKKPGDHVSPFFHNANLIGYVLMHCGSAGYEPLSIQIDNALRIEVKD
jgi:biotin carboxylase